MKTILKNYTIPALIIFFAVFFFSYGLSTQEIIAFDARFYLFAQEMWRHGPTFFPTTYHLPYPDYPSLAVFFIYCFSLMAGELTKLSAVLPTIVMAVITLIATYCIGRLHDKRLGWGAVFFLLFTLLFVRSIRSISLDMAITSITTLVFYLFYSADHLQKKRRTLLFYPLIFLGFCFRGPLGLIIPAGVMCGYLMMTKQYKRLIHHGALSLLLLLTSVMVLLFLAYYTGGASFVKAVWQMEIAGRLNNPYHPFYFYFVDSFGSGALAYPLALLVMGGIFYYRTKQYKLNQIEWLLSLLFVSSLIILLGLSIPDDKKARYILPMLPFCALIAAYLVLPQKKFYFIYLKKIMTWFCFVFPNLALIALIVLKYYSLHIVDLAAIMFTPWLFIFTALSSLQFLVYFLAKENNTLYVLGVASFTFIIILIFIVEPIQLQLEAARHDVTIIEQSRINEDAQLVFYREGKDGLPIKYLINMPQYDAPLFLKTKNELTQLEANAYVVTSKEYQSDLLADERYKKITEKKLGRVTVAVFKVK